MLAHLHPRPPAPVDPVGQRLHDIFGRNPWDFLEAPAPSPGGKPQWRTVKNYQLRPRLLWQRWQDSDTLIGVRFKSQTAYALIDLDVWSRYRNAEAIAQLRAGLETIGITRTILIRSSHSNGLHLYIPLPEPVKTFDLAVALEACLKAQGLTIANGTLEIFPNPKPYGVEKIIHYNGHRLPLQPGTGSYLLDDDLNPMGDQLEHFFRRWDNAAAQQDMDALRHALKIGRDNRRKHRRRSHSPNNHTVETWRRDLETEIADGWSGPGQTNHLLQTVVCHGRVFLGLSGDELYSHSLAKATSLPGYQRYCGHQYNIEYRVKAWCRSVENFYWPLGEKPTRDTNLYRQPQLSVNQQRAENARERIEQAIATLRQLGNLPSKIRDLALQLAAAAHCSLKTIYKHRTLWHPDHTQTTQERCVTTPSEGDTALPDATDPSPLTPVQSQFDQPEPLSDGLLHTEERSMKCERVSTPPFKTLFERGGRGERKHRFPQPREAVASMTTTGTEVQAAIQAQVHALGWSLEQVRSFHRSHFEGRDRIWQLSEAELQTYLYYLRTESLEHA